MGLGSDSALDSIVHAGLHEALGRFYPTRAAIQSATMSRRPNGEQVATWSTFTSVTGNLSLRTADELRDGLMTRVPVGMAFNIAGHEDRIAVGHRALIGATAWNITAVVHDSLRGSTRLELERVEH